MTLAQHALAPVPVQLLKGDDDTQPISETSRRICSRFIFRYAVAAELRRFFHNGFDNSCCNLFYAFYVEMTAWFPVNRFGRVPKYSRQIEIIDALLSEIFTFFY